MSDPVVKYTSGAILVLAFLGALVIAVHGYLINPGYNPPPLVMWVLGSATSAAVGALGLHVGGVQVAGGIANGAALARKDPGTG